MANIKLSHFYHYPCNSAKIVLHLNPKPVDQEPGPKVGSQFNNIRLSFRSGGQSEVGPPFHLF